MAKSQTGNAAPARTEATQFPVNYEVRIHSLRFNGAIRATASVDINGAFAVRNVRVMEGTKGLFISMPGYKAGNGEFRDVCFPCTAESREQFNRAVLDAYEQTLIQAQQQGQKNAPDQQVRDNAPAMSM